MEDGRIEMTRKEKLTIEELADLVKFSLTPNAFWEGLPEKMTVKQFGLALAKEMDYHREQDIINGVVDVDNERSKKAIDVLGEMNKALLRFGYLRKGK